MYLFLSGYGLYCSYEKNDCILKVSANIRRVLLLYARVWVIAAIFFSIGVLLFSPAYLKSIPVLIGNLTGFNTTYNGEWWFLFPYIMLVLTSGLIFRIVDKFNPLISILTAGLIYLLAYSVCKFNGEYLYSNHLVYQPLLYCTSLFSFVVGALSAKYKVFTKLRNKISCININLAQFLLIAFLIVVLGVRIFYIPFGVFDSIIAFIVLFSIVLMKRYKWIDFILTVVGKQSTNIWLIHSFFFYYFWHDFFYSLKYPMLVYILVMALSYGSGKVIDLIYNPIQKYIKSKF